MSSVPAMPITPIKPVFDVPDGSWTKDSAHSGNPASPFVASLPEPMEPAFRSVAARFGLMVETVRPGVIGYEGYVQVVPFGGGGGSGKAPPKPVLWALVRVIPMMRRRMKAARVAFESGLYEELPQRWYDEWKPRFRQRFDDGLAVDVGLLDDAALLAELDSLLTLVADGATTHFELFVPYVVGLNAFVTECERSLGWDTAKALQVLSGSSAASSEPSEALNAVAERAAGNAAAVAAITDVEPGLGERLGQAAPDIAAALDGWVSAWGHRCLDYEPGAPTYAEQPELIAHLLRQALTRVQRAHPSPGEGEPAEDLVQVARSQLHGEALARFDRTLAVARVVYPTREDNVHLLGTMPAALVRRAVLEMGARLAARGSLDRRDDVFLCEIDEVRAALTVGSLDLRRGVDRRRAEMAWVEEHPGPDQYGPAEGDAPDLSVLPEHGRRVNEALLWAMEHEFANASPDGDTVQGIPVSAGRVTGPVRVVRNDDDFYAIEDGDIIVCRVATTSWSVLLGVAGAIVCDGGGAFSHTAIIARELGIPAVLGTGNATRLLHDGQIVTVDGSAGIVT